MLTLNLSHESRWVDLAGDVRLKVKPLSTAMMLAARHDPQVLDLTPDSPADPDAPPSHVREEELALKVAKIIGGMVIEEWEGVGDADGTPVPVEQVWIDALFDLWPMFEAFQVKVVVPIMLLDAEKNVSPPLPSGRSAGAETIAKPAAKSARTARSG